MTTTSEGYTMQCFVYFNLHKRCWSIRAQSGPEKGRVVAHADTVLLDGCTFKVGEAGRQRVIREGRKNVHAGCVGKLRCFRGTETPAGLRAGLNASQGVGHNDLRGMNAISYNPYKAGHFTVCATGEPIRKAQQVILARGAYVNREDAYHVQ